MTPGTCIHYNGIRFAAQGHDCCAAGVDYGKTFDGTTPGIILRMPCIQYRTLPAHRRGTYVKAGEATVREEIDRRGHAMIPCDKFQEPTPEEVERSRAEWDAHYAKTMAAISVASAWRERPKPAQDRREVIECPICKGRLHLSQSAYNGHVAGKCETEGCVSWME